MSVVTVAIETLKEETSHHLNLGAQVDQINSLESNPIICRTIVSSAVAIDNDVDY